MSVPEFFSARNGSQTCSCNGLSLHSRFDPEKEAQRFVDSQESDFIPSVIVLCGACLPFTVPFLKLRWPQATITAIQYHNAFSGTDTAFDHVFYCTEHTTAAELSESLFGFLGDETAFSTLFMYWAPADKAWPQESAESLQAVKLYLTKSRDVIGTRNYFNQRWLRNMVRFFSLTGNFVTVAPVHKPVVIAASGPTLQHSLPVIKANRPDIFLLALSSAVLPLSDHDIIPDAVLSTDGGWWAMHHLFPLLTEPRLKDIPLWITAESAVPGMLLKSHPIQYLSYGDPVESWLLSALNGQHATRTPLPAFRNGTVSGTALRLAVSLTDNAVFFCGLDLASGSGFQHTQPNRLELRDSTADYRLKPKEHRCTPRTFPNGSLNLYRNWFTTRSRDQVSRVYRVLSAEEQQMNPPLGFIRDLSPAAFEELLHSGRHGSPDTRHTAASRQPSVRGTNRQQVSKALVTLKQLLLAPENLTSPDSLICAVLKSAALPEFLMAQRTGGSNCYAAACSKAEELLNQLIILAEKLEGTAV